MRYRIFNVAVCCGLISLLLPVGCAVDPGGSDDLMIEDHLSSSFFGALDSPSVAVIGEVTDLAFMPNGNVLVLDARSSRVTLLDADLDYVAHLGKKGAGPGELSVPSAITALNDHVILVSERATRRISKFAFVHDKPQFIRSFRVEHDVHDMCMMGDTLIVQGVRDKAPMQAYDSAGNFIRSFGSLLSAPVEHPLIGYYLEKGAIVCDQKNKRMYFAASALPFIQVYDNAGTLVDVDTIPHFVAARFSIVGDGLRVSLPDEGFDDSIVALALAEGDAGVIIQIRRVRMVGRDKNKLVTEFRTLRYAHGTQTAFSPMTFAPGAPFAVMQERAYVMEREPFPKIRIVSFEGHDLPGAKTSD